MDNRAISSYVRAYIKRKKIKDTYKPRQRELTVQLRDVEAQANELLEENPESIGPVVWNDRAHYIRRVSRKRVVKPRDIEDVVSELVGEGEALSEEDLVQACYDGILRRVETFRTTVARTPEPGEIVAPSEDVRGIVERFCEVDAERKELSRQSSDEVRAHTQSIAELKETVLDFLQSSGDTKSSGEGEKVTRTKKINVETRSGKIDMTLCSTTAYRRKSLTFVNMRRRGIVEQAIAQIHGLASDDGTFPATEAFQSALITALTDACEDLCAGDQKTTLGVKLKTPG